MIALGDGCDSSWLIILRAAGYGAWQQLAGWFKLRAAQVLQQAHAVGGHGKPAPAAGRPVQDAPHEGEAAGLAGEAADDLDSPAGLSERSFDEVGVADAVVMLGAAPIRWTISCAHHAARLRFGDLAEGRGAAPPPASASGLVERTTDGAG
jgi:hypothetical protein